MSTKPFCGDYSLGLEKIKNKNVRRMGFLTWPPHILGFKNEASTFLLKTHGATIGLADHCTPINQLKSVCCRSTPKRLPLIKNCPVETVGHRRTFDSGKCPPPYYKGTYEIE